MLLCHQTQAYVCNICVRRRKNGHNRHNIVFSYLIIYHQPVKYNFPWSKAGRAAKMFLRRSPLFWLLFPEKILPDIIVKPFVSRIPQIGAMPETHIADQLDAGEELTFTDMTGRVFRYTVRKICHADNARAETLADSESALTLFVKKMELFSSSDVQRHSILFNRRCRTAPVDNGKLRRPTQCRYDSLFNFLFITHEGPPL